MSVETYHLCTKYLHPDENNKKWMQCLILICTCVSEGSFNTGNTPPTDQSIHKYNDDAYCTRVH